jgi:hypothetical protein
MDAFQQHERGMAVAKIVEPNVGEAGVGQEQPPPRRQGVRVVASNGIVSVDHQMFSVGNAFKAELVDVFVDDTVIQVWSKNHLIKTVARTRKGPVRKVRADGLHVKRQPTTERQASAGT